MKYHTRILLSPESGTISNTINYMLSLGYMGGDIELTGYAPSDTYLGLPFGVIKWTKVSTNIAYLQFLRDRSTEIINRAIVIGESDTGWVLH